MPAQSPPERLVIFYNDLTDSDNWIAARFVHKWASTNGWRVVWVVEPRQVSFGLDMTEEQKSECQNLIQKHFSDKGSRNPFKVLLAGLIDDRDLAKVDLDQADHEILKLAVKRPHGSKEDAVLHGRLISSDLLICLAEWSNGPVEVILDVDSLLTLENPVNLNMHHHEELTARTPEELAVYNSHMKLPFPQRADELRGWYQSCNDRLGKQFAQQGHSVRHLNLKDLCNQITAAREVKFFGGGSLGILKRLYEEGVSRKMQCYMQAGAFDLSRNLFPNQFNILLNPKAAKFVFDHHREFSDFAVVPTTTTQSIKFTLGGLAAGGGGRALEKRFLGFNCHVDPMKIATGETTLKSGDLASKAFYMPDLTAFLCTFLPGFRGTTVTRAVLVESRGGVLTLEKDEAGNSFKVMEREPLIGMGEPEIQELLSSLGQHPA